MPYTKLSRDETHNGRQVCLEEEAQKLLDTAGYMVDLASFVRPGTNGLKTVQEIRKLLLKFMAGKIAYDQGRKALTVNLNYFFSENVEIIFFLFLPLN